MFRRLLFVLAVIAASAPVAARTPVPAYPLVELALVDRDTAQTLPEYRHRGRDWVAGTPGHRYAVRLTNTSGERVLVVLSVDGVNAVSGQTAAPSQAGYVLGPWESAEIGGWRKSLDDIAQFVFTDLQGSYASRTGRPDNVGVVGIAVFRERWRRPLPPAAPVAAAPRAEAGAKASADRAMTMEAMPQRIGTGHGQREHAPVGQTTFERASASPEQISELRYDSLDALVAMGVLPRRNLIGVAQPPRAFPGEFVADPPGR
ncbi:hypothetical protein [Thermomonas sp.]|jgi:hypothetical protein|nr:hypothetical protein [Thermomonas sp.]